MAENSVIWKEDQEANKKEYDKIVEWLSDYQKSRVLEDLSCPIWYQLIDMWTNLQWLFWRRTFWSSCLIESLATTDKYPNWRSCIISKCLIINKSMMATLELVVKVGTPSEVKREDHDERCDLYWELWEIGIWSNWVLASAHATHDLTSLNDLNKETCQKWVEMSKDNKSTTEAISKKVTSVWDSKYLLDLISNEPINMLQKIIKDHNFNFNEKVSRSYNQWIKSLNKNLKKSQENTSNISKFSKVGSKVNMIKTAESFKDQERIEQDVSLISEESVKENNLVVFDPPTTEVFMIRKNELVKNTTILITKKDKTSCIWSLNIIHKDSDIWDIIVQRIDDTGGVCYVKINSLSGCCKITDANKFTKLETESKVTLNDFWEMNFSSVNNWDYIEFELNIWTVNDEIQKYTNSTKESIKEVLQKFIDDL